jgi:hypothetical protein
MDVIQQILVASVALVIPKLASQKLSEMRIQDHRIPS